MIRKKRTHGNRKANMSSSLGRTGSASANPAASGSGSGGGASSGARGQNSTTEEWQILRHKQQRLLLLQHASTCEFEAGKCTVTPHCAQMKNVWEHVAHCKNQQCTVQHCISSRNVLLHYQRCRDPRCPACGPVRSRLSKAQGRKYLPETQALVEAMRKVEL